MTKLNWVDINIVHILYGNYLVPQIQRFHIRLSGAAFKVSRYWRGPQNQSLLKVTSSVLKWTAHYSAHGQSRDTQSEGGEGGMKWKGRPGYRWALWYPTGEGQKQSIFVIRFSFRHTCKLRVCVCVCVWEGGSCSSQPPPLHLITHLSL